MLNRCSEQIKLREGIEKTYGISVMNKDGVNIGMDIIKHEYLKKSGLKWNDIKDLRSPCPEINLNEIILPFIKYDTPILQEMLGELKQLTVSPGRKGYERHFLLDNLEYCMGVGGIHSVNEPDVFTADDNWILSDVDVASMYPSLILAYEFYPPHLGPAFLETYGDIKRERIEAKHNGDKIKNETLKLALNGLSGNLQSEYSFVYSPKTVMQIRMNGQLLLLMLAEKLIGLGCKILNCNTDGLFVKRPRSKEKEFQQACKEWEELTKLTLEEDRFEKFCQFAINDYLAIKEGYSETKDPKLLKKKGLFIDTVTLGKGMQPMIIPKALNAYFADGVSPEETVMNNHDINDFITYQKVDKKFKVIYENKQITRINRYYVAKQAPYLYKQKSGGNLESLLKASGVRIVNDLTKIKEFPKDVNYSYYLGEIRKIISKFENKVLSLW